MALAHTSHGSFYYFEPDVIGRTIAADVFWDYHFRPYIDTLEDGDVFVDVGANIGFFTIYAARKGCKVYSFECSEPVFDLLKRNVELNSVQDKVVLHDIALYDSVRFMKLNPEWEQVDYETAPNSGGMSLVPVIGHMSGDVVLAKALDEFAIPKVNLIKIDTQGADLGVLYGARETIKRCKPTILFEIEPIPARLHGHTDEMYMQFMAEMNYTVHELFSGAHGYKDYVGVPNG